MYTTTPEGRLRMILREQDARRQRAAILQLAATASIESDARRTPAPRTTGATSRASWMTARQILRAFRGRHGLPGQGTLR